MPRTHKVEFRLSQEGLWETTVDEAEAMVGLVAAIAQLQAKTDGAGEDKIDLSVLVQFSAHVHEVRGFLCKFVWRDGAYLSHEDASPIVGQLTMRQLYDGLLAIAGKIPELAVPPENGGTSDSP